MNKVLLPLSIAATLLLAGCGSDATTAEAPSVEPANPGSSTSAEAEPTTEETTEAEPTEDAEPTEEATSEAPALEKSERGNLVKQVGEGAGMTYEGEQTVSFVINSITVDAPCTAEFATPPENGHFVILDVSVKTEPVLAEAPITDFYMTAHEWKAIAPNGTTSNASPGTAAAFMCLNQQEMLPDTLGPAEQATGKLVLDVENPSGILVYQDPLATAGWEWTYPGQ